MNLEASRDKKYQAFLALAAALAAIFSLRAATFNSTEASQARPVAYYGITGLFPSLPVDLNAATAEDLRILPGKGEKTAERIIERREELGGFKSVDDLLEVKFIGEAKLDKIRSLVTIKAGKD